MHMCYALHLKSSQAIHHKMGKKCMDIIFFKVEILMTMLFSRGPPSLRKFLKFIWNHKDFTFDPY